MKGRPNIIRVFTSFNTSCIIRANKMSATVHQLDSNIPFQTMHKDLHAILIYSISG